MTHLPRVFLIILVLLLSAGNAIAHHTLPAGDYNKTCINCRVFDNNLSCFCYKKNHGPKYTKSTLANTCRYYTNANGKLRCIKRMVTLPKGKYRQSCRRCRFDGKVLGCDCKALNMDNEVIWHKTTLTNSHRCNGGIENEHGHLRCVQVFARYKTAPGGSYLLSCERCKFDRHKILSCYCKQADKPQLLYSRVFHPHRCLDIENISGRLSCLTQ